MDTLSHIDSKTIDELQELGKLTGTEKTIVSYKGEETRKVSIDTIIGYAASVLASVSSGNPLPVAPNSSGVVFIPEGEEIPLSQRTPGCFYLEETRQNSIRTKVSVPTSVTVSSTLGLRRV